LEKSTLPGCDKPTSRWQAKTSLWSLSFYYSVIPTVLFICCSITLSLSLIGSIKPTFVSAQLIRFAVKQTYTFSLKREIFLLNLPLYFFVTFWKNSVPEKLKFNNCLSKDKQQLAIRTVFHYSFDLLSSNKRAVKAPVYSKQYR